jgi:hypothetical protein
VSNLEDLTNPVKQRLDDLTAAAVYVIGILIIVASGMVQLKQAPPALYASVVSRYSYTWLLVVPRETLTPFFSAITSAAATLWVVTLAILTLAQGWFNPRLFPPKEVGTPTAIRLGLKSWLWEVVTIVSASFLSPFFYALMMLLPGTRGFAFYFAGIVSISALWGAMFLSRRELRKALIKVATISKMINEAKTCVDGLSAEQSRFNGITARLSEATREQSSDAGNIALTSEEIKQLVEFESKLGDAAKRIEAIATTIYAVPSTKASSSDEQSSKYSQRLANLKSRLLTANTTLQRSNARTVAGKNALDRVISHLPEQLMFGFSYLSVLLYVVVALAPLAPIIVISTAVWLVIGVYVICRGSFALTSEL